MNSLFDAELEVPRDALFEPMVAKLAAEGIFQLQASAFEWAVTINSYCELAKFASLVVAYARSENPAAMPLGVVGVRLLEDGKVGLDLATSMEDTNLSATLDSETMPFVFFRLRASIDRDVLGEYCEAMAEALNGLLEEAREVVAACNPINLRGTVFS